MCVLGQEESQMSISIGLRMDEDKEGRVCLGARPGDKDT